MADDRRRDAPEEPTTGQRVHRDVAGFGTDSTISAPAATPELIATGLAQLAAERFDPLGATLDLPASDQVATAGHLDPGQLIGRFVIRSRLGEGGMGIVLAGHDADLGRPVAIKVVKDSADHPAYRARLLREAQVMARLEHPNVVRVYEVGTDRGRLFVAMELIDGVTLTTWLAVQRRPWREILAMFRQVGAGLAAVHRAGLVHRDFKPDNALVDRDGRARVADFGLARLDPDRTTVSPELAASLTRTGMMVGTPAYMAPEQHFGGDVDARADQYSFCVALREALIGSRPSKIEEAHWGEVPRGVRVAINRGAAIEVGERFASMDELLDALARGAGRRTVYLAAATGVVLVGAVIGAVVVTNTSSSPSSAPAQHVVAIDASAPAKVAVVDPSPPPRPIAEPLPVIEKPAATKVRSSAPTAGSTVVTPMTPVKETKEAKRHNLEGANPAHEMPAAHRAAVRSALRDFGFLGVTLVGDDRDADIRELEAKLADTTEDLQRGMLVYGMALAERAQDNCNAAMKHFSEARKLVIPATKDPGNKKRHDLGFLFFGRIRVGEMWCELMAGRALGVSEKLQNALVSMWAAGEPERAEVLFAWGIAEYETGEVDHGKQLLRLAAEKNAKLRAAIETYGRSVGLSSSAP
ncbi:MAG: serine/threonine protein kinase [Myxococcota bacterium]|nr:serine/threonine protein kinase [Myxococcota bacterium]